MVDKKITCKDCCKEISEDTNKLYKGYCKNCYDERYANANANSNPNINDYHRVAKLFFIVVAISSIVAGFNIHTDTYNDFNFPITLTILSVGFIFFYFFYMLATIIQELRNLQEK